MKKKHQEKYIKWILILTTHKAVVTKKSGKYYEFQHIKSLIVIIEGKIWKIIIWSVNKNLGIDKKSKITNFLK